MVRWILLCAMLAPAVARAETPATAVSVHLPAVYSRALGVQGERWLDWGRLSLAAGVGVRSIAMADYDSLTVGAGVEARRWLGEERMRGWYLGLRLDGARTTVEAAAHDRRVGSTVSLALAATVGYRFLLFRRVELTPALGAAVIEEIDPSGRMAPATRGAGVIGLTAGWMF